MVAIEKSIKYTEDQVNVQKIKAKAQEIRVTEFLDNVGIKHANEEKDDKGMNSKDLDTEKVK